MALRNFSKERSVSQPARLNDIIGGVTYPRNQNQQTESMQSNYHLTRDPLFFATMVFFAILTTALPGAMGQPRFMPLTQTLGLLVFTAAAIRRDETAKAIGIAALWLVTQFITLVLVGVVLPGQINHAISNGMNERLAYLQWFYTGVGLPHSLRTQPLEHLGQLVGVGLGSLLSGGLVGAWFLVKAVDFFAFTVSSLLVDLAAPIGFVAGMTPWRLLVLAAYTGFFVLLAEPILTNRWQLSHYTKNRRSLLMVSLVLLITGYLLEIVLPGAWSALFRPA